jgi:hypothetical protein
MAFPGIWLTPGATVSLQGSYSSVIKTHRPVRLHSRSSGRLPRFLLLNDRFLASDAGREYQLPFSFNLGSGSQAAGQTVGKQSRD